MEVTLPACMGRSLQACLGTVLANASGWRGRGKGAGALSWCSGTAKDKEHLLRCTCPKGPGIAGAMQGPNSQNGPKNTKDRTPSCMQQGASPAAQSLT
eukprot:1142566-Pelagomonas_calceolata.AAC.4